MAQRFGRLRGLSEVADFDITTLASTTSASSATSKILLSQRTSRARSLVCGSSRRWTLSRKMWVATRLFLTARRRTRASTLSVVSRERVWRWHTTTRRSERCSRSHIGNFAGNERELWSTTADMRAWDVSIRHYRRDLQDYSVS
jgi:hypothetical protein